MNALPPTSGPRPDHQRATSGADPAVLAEVAERLAREVGAMVREGRPRRVEVAATKSSLTDVVTAMDLAAEQRLRERLAQERPGDGILGEEDGHVPGETGVTWVLDPVDGTVNYLYGIPAYAVSVAAVVGPPDPHEWTVLAGCVHAVADGRTWTAAKGLGTREDGVPVRVNPPRPLAESLVATGFGYRAERRREQARVLAEVLPRVRDVRRIGSSAIDMGMVASGNLDAYYERGLGAWDLAAASIVAAEAGATVVGLHGRPASSSMLVAGPEPTVRELVAILEDLGADQGA